MSFYQTTHPKLRNIQHVTSTKLVSSKDTRRANKTQAYTESMNMDSVFQRTVFSADEAKNKRFR